MMLFKKCFRCIWVFLELGTLCKDLTWQFAVRAREWCEPAATLITSSPDKGLIHRGWSLDTHTHTYTHYLQLHSFNHYLYKNSNNTLFNAMKCTWRYTYAKHLYVSASSSGYIAYRRVYVGGDLKLTLCVNAMLCRRIFVNKWFTMNVCICVLRPGELISMTQLPLRPTAPAPYFCVQRWQPIIILLLLYCLLDLANRRWPAGTKPL